MPPTRLHRAATIVVNAVIMVLCCPCYLLASHVTRHSTSRSKGVRRCRCKPHPAIIVAAGAPPLRIFLPTGGGGELDHVVQHVLYDGNRIFHLRPDTGMLTSGNMGVTYDLEVVGRPVLAATVSRADGWRPLLQRFRSVREDVMRDVGVGEDAEREWVLRCCKALEEEEEGRRGERLRDGGGEDGGGGGEVIEVWSVMVHTEESETAVVVDNTMFGWYTVGAYFLLTGKNQYLWATRVNYRDSENRTPGSDLFPGQWTDDYVVGNAPSFHPDPWWNNLRFSRDSAVSLVN